MAPSVTKYCLQEVTDYSDFESLCHDLMAREGYPKIEPLGRFSDRGRDAIHVDKSGNVTIFAYSVREDWRAKLAEDAAKIKKHKHDCDELVFICTADFSANERDEAVGSILDDYGWKLTLYGLERLRVLLDASHPITKPNHPAIFPPALLNHSETSSATKDHLLMIFAPADQIFAEWLSRKLTADGYSVWCESIRSLGDDVYPDNINNALKNGTFRALAVYSQAFFQCADAIGLRAVSMVVGKEDEVDLVIPLLLDNPEKFPEVRPHSANAILFESNWASGLRQLSETLVGLSCPRPRFDGRDVSAKIYLENDVLKSDSETLYSNAFQIEAIPNTIHRFRINRDFSEKDYRNYWAFRKLNDELVVSFFFPPDILGKEEAKSIGVDSWRDMTQLTWSDRRETRKIAINNLIPELIRKTVLVHCHDKGLKHCSETDLMYFPDGLLPRNRIPGRLPDGTKLSALGVYGERKYYRPGDRSTYYRYYLAPTFFVDSYLFRDPDSGAAVNDFGNTVLYIRLRNRFTDTDNVVLAPRTAQSRRKHLCKGWWNDDWFKRTLAVAQFLADDGMITIGAESGQQIMISAMPRSFDVSGSIDEEALDRLGIGKAEVLPDQHDSDEDEEGGGTLEDV